MKCTMQEYTNLIADYINDEYDSGYTELGKLTDDEKHTIRNMIFAHYEFGDSINNVSNYIMNYLVENRKFLNDLKEKE